MRAQEGEAAASYLIPSRTISGSPEEMLEQIDEAIQGLLALRHLITVKETNPAPPGAEAGGFRIRLVRSQSQGKDSAKG